VGPRAGLGDIQNRKFLTLEGLELRLLSRRAHSQSLYRLHYPGYSIQHIYNVKSTFIYYVLKYWSQNVIIKRQKVTTSIIWSVTPCKCILDGNICEILRLKINIDDRWVQKLHEYEMQVSTVLINISVRHKWKPSIMRYIKWHGNRLKNMFSKLH
jgi:hypothetical protein